MISKYCWNLPDILWKCSPDGGVTGEVKDYKFGVKLKEVSLPNLLCCRSEAGNWRMFGGFAGKNND